MNTLNGYSKSTLSDLYSLTAAGGHFPIHSGRNNEANKLVRTDANGYLNAGWINTTSGAFTGTPSRIYASNDAYIRYMTPANFFPTLTNTSNLLDITIGGLNRKLTIDYSKVSGSTKTLDYKSLPSTTSNASNTVWCSFARITFNTGAWVAANGYIFLGDAESYGYSGILYYEFRSSSTATAIGKASLLWLVKNKDTASIIAVKVEDNIYDLYINNYSTYSCPIIYHMSSTISRFTWNVGSWTTTKPTAAYTASDTGRVNYANSAGSSTNVIVNLHTGNDIEYPLVWSNETNTSNKTANLLFKSYSNLVYNPKHNRITAGTFRSGSSTFGGGVIELYTSVPFIDFHYNSSTSDYTSRIIEGLEGLLTVTGKLRVGLAYNTSTDYKFYVAGDSYTSGWSRAASGFYVHDKGVHFSNNGSNKFGEIACTSGNEFMWGSSAKDLYFNYRAASRGTTVTKFIWNAGSSTTYAAHTLGELVSKNDQTLYGLTSTCNKDNDASYTKAAMLIREYNFGGSQSDTWAIAPRLSWHWSGRVLTLIGLASGGDLYLSKNNFTNAYLLLHLGNSSITDYNVKIGGTTKLFVRDWGHGAANMNAVARGGRSSMGMADLSTPSGGTATAVNPNGGTSWHHFINIAYTDGGAGSNSWVTQIANKAGTTDLWVRSRSGGTISDTANWTAGWTRILTGTNYSSVLDGRYYTESEADSRFVNVTGDTMTGALNFANGTWNKVGDDSAMGDCNKAGLLGIKSLNNNLPGIAFFNSSGTQIGSFYSEASVPKWDANTMWHAGNDGSGSGLDADKLDGKHLSDLNVDLVYTIDCNSLSDSNFYPIVFSSSTDPLHCRIRSSSRSGSHAWNQNTMEFIYCGSGWSDTPHALTITNYGCYSTSEITIGCIGRGNEGGVVCIWVRGGSAYYLSSNRVGSLKTSNYTSGNEIYTVGTNYYGSANTKVTILFTPLSTISSGNYASGNFKAGNNCYAAHFYENSDIKLKTNIEAITSSSNIPQLKSFDWKSDGSHSYGLIALELEEMGYSELVDTSGEHKTVKYSAALSLIVGKLQVKIRELEKEIENLKNKN